MGVDVEHMDDDPGTGDGRGARGCQLQLARRAVQPDDVLADAHLAVHRLASAVAHHAARLHPEGTHEEVVGRRDVVVDQDGNHLLARHVFLPRVNLYLNETRSSIPVGDGPDAGS